MCGRDVGTRAQQPCEDRSPDLQLHPDIVTSTGDFSDVTGGDGFYLLRARCQQGQVEAACELLTPNPITLLPAPALWGASCGHPSSFPPHPGLARGQDLRRGRCGAGGGAPALQWSSDTQTWASILTGEPPCTAPSRWLAGRAPALQSCQLSRGAYTSPAVPSGAGAFVPSCHGGRESPQLRAEHPSKHQSPSVLPAKFHRLALLVPRSAIYSYLSTALLLQLPQQQRHEALSPAQPHRGLLWQGGEKMRCTHSLTWGVL